MFIPVVSLLDTSPKGEGSIRRYFCGEDTGDMIGAHLLLLGEAGFINGSKSRVLLRVAPQAMTPSSVKRKLGYKTLRDRPWAAVPATDANSR